MHERFGADLLTGLEAPVVDHAGDRDTGIVGRRAQKLPAEIADGAYVPPRRAVCSLSSRPNWRMSFSSVFREDMFQCLAISCRSLWQCSMRALR